MDLVIIDGIMALAIIFIIFLLVYNNTLYKSIGITKNEYREIKKENKKKKINKTINIIFTIISFTFLAFFICTLVLGFLWLGTSIITLFGIAYIDTGNDPTNYENITKILGLCAKASLYSFDIWRYALLLKIIVKQSTLMERLKKIGNKTTNINTPQSEQLNEQISEKPNEQTSVQSTCINNKEVLNKTIKKLAIIIIAIIVVIASLVVSSKISKNYKEANKNLKEVIDNVPSYYDYNDTSYYFIYNNKIYYYSFDYDRNIPNAFYSMDLDGTNNKLIAESGELTYASFYFVYNNEAYYYSLYNDTNRKINLETGIITDLDNNDVYLSKTLNNGMIYTFIDNAVVGNAYAKFKKIDLNTDKKIFEIKTDYSVVSSEYYFDYDGNNIYYLESFYSDYPSIIKNKDIIYQFTDYDRYSFPKTVFIAANKEYIYYKQNDYIYKLDSTTGTIVNEFECDIGDFKRISSGNNKDNYFYANHKIYSFDFDSNTFEIVLDNIRSMPEKVYHMNDELIFTENTDNLVYLTEENNLGSVIVYNLKNKDIQTYVDVRKFCYDDKYLYLVIDKYDKYSIEKIEYKK